MERFIQQLVLVALFLSGSWLWGMISPSANAELRRMRARSTATDSPDESTVEDVISSGWSNNASDEVLLSGQKDTLADSPDEMAPTFEPMSRFPDLIPIPPLELADTPFDSQAGSSSGDVAYQLSPAWEYQAHFSAADLLKRAPKARPWRDELGLRFGWWGTSTSGSPVKVGEFQSLSASPFWDVNRLLSNGTRTLDLYGTGLNNEGNDSGFYFFGPKVSVSAIYQRYLRRLDHDPLTNMPPPDPSLPGGEGIGIVSEDLDVGEDYAIRVQNLRTHVKGKLAKNVKYRINFWMQRKKGDRQAIATQHCQRASAGGGNNNECHVLSQTQRIDWLTMKIEPVIEARFGHLTVEYARPMRFFTKTDQEVTRDFGEGHIYNFSGDYPYGVVPENFTQTDRLKLGLDLPFDSHFYGRLQTGNTENRNRDTNRRFSGYDLRWTNRFWDRWTFTGFARMNRQSNQFPPFFVDPEELATSDTASSGLPLRSSIIPQYGLRTPISYSREAMGAEANWRPFRWTDLSRGLALNFGFEHGHIGREFAEYQVQEPAAIVDQNHTPYTSYFVGTSMKWTLMFDTYVRYKGRSTENPLFGVNRFTGETNSNQPEQEHRIEVGGSWMPADNLIATANVGFENRRQDSDVANFDENNYPITFTLWYAPTTQWSFSTGYSHFSNWIDQEIYFPSNTPGIETYDRRSWNYGGTGQVVNVGGSYAWTPNISFSGGVEFVWARNAVAPFEPWPDLSQYYDVVVDRTRVTGGVDCWLHDGISAYFRYVYDDYQDTSAAYNSGTAHMALAGFSALY